MISGILSIFYVKPSDRAKVVWMLEVLRIVIGSPLINSHDCVLGDMVPADIGATFGNEASQCPWDWRIYSQRLIHTGSQVSHVVNQVQVQVLHIFSRASDLLAELRQDLRVG
jgi:hypothetical protein